MTGGLAVSLAASLLVLLTSCSDLGTIKVGDDMGPTPEEMLRDFRCDLSDAGLNNQDLRYCAVAPFFDKCPLRLCVEQIARIVAAACPEADAGLPRLDEQFCDALGDLARQADNSTP